MRLLLSDAERCEPAVMGHFYTDFYGLSVPGLFTVLEHWRSLDLLVVTTGLDYQTLHVRMRKLKEKKTTFKSVIDLSVQL